MKRTFLAGALLAATLAAPAGAGGAKSCSTAGLRYTDERDGATFTARVEKLRATHVSCKVARDVAGRVVRLSVEGRTVPKTYRSFRISDTTKCRTCGPTSTYRATRAASGGRRSVVTFTSAGGGS